MKIIKINIDEITPYKNNAKMHTPEQIEQIKRSIEQFGMNDPIAVWGKDNIIVEGHGRLEALKQLGYTEVDCIRLDHLTDEERKAYTLAHNKLTMNTDFDFDILNMELGDIADIDMSNFGFDLEFEEEEEEDKTYTNRIDIPHYEVTGEQPQISELLKEDKSNKLINKIKKSNISVDEKEFLIKASARHYAFDYSKIAEYYAHADREMQELMEESALVIIDYKDAIKNGYALLSKEINKMSDEDYEE